MACYDAGDFTCTYDSDALEGKDYSVLATWESASDNDLSGTGITILDCFDSQVHDDSVELGGATNTDSTHYRVIRSAPDCATPFAGKDGTGATFDYDGAEAYIFEAGGPFARIVNLCVNYIGSAGAAAYTIRLTGVSSKAIGVVAHDCVSSGGTTTGIYANADLTLIYACIAYAYKTYGIMGAAGLGETIGILCCTAVGSGTYGFNSGGSVQGTLIGFSDYAKGNTNDYDPSHWSAPGGWCAAGDDNGDAPGANYKNNIDYTGSMDADYLATAHISANGNEGDRCGRNPYNDVTATTDFDDFLKNDTDGDPLFRLDIAGNARPGWDEADAVWDVGASGKKAIPSF